MDKMRVKVKIFLLLAAVAASGCAASSRMFIGPSGNATTCQSSGYGLIGVAHANKIQNSCEAQMRAAGMLPLDEAGSVGFIPSQQLRVLSVSEGTPAHEAGVQVGWYLRAIDGVDVNDLVEAQALMFAPAGQPVSLRFETSEGEVELTMVRITAEAAIALRTPPDEKPKEKERKESPFD